MKKYFLLIFFVMLTSVSSSMLASSNENKTILLSPDQLEFTITLSSNPSTGFIWLIDSYDQQLLTLAQHDYRSSKNKKALAAPKLEQWVFKMKEKTIAPQLTKIILIHARPWDIANTVTEKKVFTVVLT